MKSWNQPLIKVNSQIDNYAILFIHEYKSTKLILENQFIAELQ